mmetsp:Transcript_2069/g.5744  ORF Transcript_2069/g.5744 Transcript_2069/m.5744 type:complete len:207 (-) Transcript_2069:161-781(-)
MTTWPTACNGVIEPYALTMMLSNSSGVGSPPRMPFKDSSNLSTSFIILSLMRSVSGSMTSASSSSAPSLPIIMPSSAFSISSYRASSSTSSSAPELPKSIGEAAAASSSSTAAPICFLFFLPPDFLLALRSFFFCRRSAAASRDGACANSSNTSRWCPILLACFHRTSMPSLVVAGNRTVESPAMWRVGARHRAEVGCRNKRCDAC